MIEQMDGSYDNPFKFNAKELDEDSGLYYYGARYYNPRLSIWYGVDPLAVYNPVMEKEFYGDGQHNGGVYFWGNLNPYIYTYQNPIRYIDPNGKQVEWNKHWNRTKEFLNDAGDVLHKTAENLSPMTVHFKTPQEIAASKAKYGEGPIASLTELWDNAKSVPGNLADQLDALGDVDFEDIQERFNNASGKEKAEMATTLGTMLLSLRKGKIDTKGLALLGAGGSNFKILTAGLLKKAGIDAHKLKYEFLGKKAKISEYDLYKHTDTNEVLIMKKGGTGDPIHTGEYIKK